MWDLRGNDYCEEYKMGLALFYNKEHLETGMVMYKNNVYSILFCYHEYDNKNLSDIDKHEMETIIKKELKFGEV